jgi:prepilin-type N-terminal cleavage/methylation domain-containing protein
MKLRLTKDDDGFSLIEVLVAFIILSGAIISAFQVFGDGLRGLGAGQSRAREVAIAQHQIDLLSISQTLVQGVINIAVENVKLRIVTAPIPVFVNGSGFTILLFKVSVFLGDQKNSNAPILETILLAKPSTP